MAQQIKKKFIGNDQVDGSKLLLLNGQSIRKLDGSGVEFDLVADIEGQIAAEESRALAAEGALASDIADVNTRVDNVLTNMDGTALNSLAEIVTAFQAADSDLNGAITLLASDLDTRIDGVDSTVAAIDGRLTTAEGDINALESGKVDKTGNSDLSGTHQWITTYPTGESESSSVSSGGIGGIFQTAAVNGDFSTFSLAQDYFKLENTPFAGTATEVLAQNGQMSLKTGANASIPTLDEHVVTKKHLDDELAALSSGGIAAIQSELDATQAGAGLGVDGSYTAPVGSNYLGSAVSLKDADSKLDAQIKVVADGLAQEILDRSADVDAEETRALAAESALDLRIDDLEAVAWYNEKFVVNSTILSNGFVTLAHTPIAGSIVANVDRLSIFEGASEDFTVASAVVTFLNELVSPGNQAIQIGDEVRFKYQA